MPPPWSDWPWDGILARLLLREGGYINHSQDSGGPTNFGCTIATLEDWRGVPCGIDDIKNLDATEACDIYWNKWIKHPRLRLDLFAFAVGANQPIIAEIILDHAIMFAAGRRRAALWLQQAINARRPRSVAEDGFIGPGTRHALTLVSEDAVLKLMIGYRIGRHVDVVTERPSQIVFLKGWINRAIHFLGIPPP